MGLFVMRSIISGGLPTGSARGTAGPARREAGGERWLQGLSDDNGWPRTCS